LPAGQAVVCRAFRSDHKVIECKPITSKTCAHCSNWHVPSKSASTTKDGDLQRPLSLYGSHA